MRRIVVLAIFLALTGPAMAAGSDEEYLEIYNEILQGDGLLQSDHPNAAALRYLQAQSDLKRLQAAHPAWNPDIVKYRVDYLAEKLQALEKYLPSTKPPPAPAPAPVTQAPIPQQQQQPPPPAPIAPANPALEQENSGLKEQVRSLTSANNELEGKLKEALSVQPAAISPDRLAKAEARILALQKERDLLSVALEQQKTGNAGVSAAANNAAIEQAMAQVKAHAAAELQKAGDEVARYKAAATESETKLVAANKEIESLKAARAADAEQMAAATARLEADAKKAQDEVARLREAGAESAKTLAAATKELELLKATRPPEVEIEGAKQIPEGPDQLKQSLAQIARDEAEITTLRAAAAETDKKLAAATSELEAMKASHPADAQAVEAMKATTEERDRLKEELAARSKELADAENRHNEEMAKVRVALEQARQQRDALEKQIASGATAGAADKPAALRLDQLEARIAVLEAKPVPYTPEERALLKISVASAPAEPPEASVSPAHVHSIKDLPPGTGILWSEAMRASVAGDFGAAEEKYKEVLRQDETNVFVLAFLANTQFAAGHLGDCEKTVKRALAVDPEDPGSLYLLGLLRYRQERLDEAIDALSLSAKINPTNSATQNFLGCVLADKGLRPAAETAFRKALQSEPDYADAHFNLAIVYAESQPPSWELARWHYRRALALGHTKSATLDKALGENGGQAKP